MKRTQYGLTEAGFVIKPLSVILEEEKEAFRSAFGDDVDLSDESVAGAYVGNQAAKLAALWEQLEGLWNAGDKDSASGMFLDRLAAFVNVSREPAKKTQVTACLWGKPGTEVPKGSLSKLSTTEELFALTKTVTISKDTLLGIELKVSDVNDLSLIINTVTVSISPEEGDTEEDLRDALIEAVTSRFSDSLSTETVGDDGLRIIASDGVTDFYADVSGVLEIKSLGTPAVFAAKEAGRIYAPSGTLTKMVSNVSGVDSITNYATGVTGRDAESDTELRQNMTARQKQATCTEPAIENAISKLTGVTYTRVYSNRDIIEVDGRPPKSYEAVVVGGDSQVIAETIFANGPAGIQAYGNTVQTVKDSQGFDWQVGFSRPVNKNIWVKIVLSLYDEEEFPAGGANAIKSNIVEWGAVNLGVAVDLIFQRLSIPVYAVPGIAHADIKVAATLDPDTPPDDSAYQAANISIGEVEIAVLDESRISVEVVS